MKYISKCTFSRLGTYCTYAAQNPMPVVSVSTIIVDDLGRDMSDG